MEILNYRKRKYNGKINLLEEKKFNSCFYYSKIMMDDNFLGYNFVFNERINILINSFRDGIKNKIKSVTVSDCYDPFIEIPSEFSCNIKKYNKKLILSNYEKMIDNDEISYVYTFVRKKEEMKIIFKFNERRMKGVDVIMSKYVTCIIFDFDEEIMNIESLYNINN